MVVSRERIEGIVRTALVTWNAKHNLVVPHVNEFLQSIGDAYDESVRVLHAVEAGHRSGPKGVVTAENQGADSGKITGS